MHNTWLGTETEYALIYFPTQNSSRPSNRLIFDCLKEAIANHVTTITGTRTEAFEPRYFMHNGGCFYFEWHPTDTRSGLIEFATPECTSPMQLLHYKKAQQDLLKTCLPDTQKRLNARGFRGTLKILKNSRDAYGNVYGEQENYQIAVASKFRFFVYCLTAILCFIPVFLAHILINVIAVIPTIVLVGVAVIQSMRQTNNDTKTDTELEEYFRQAIQPIMTFFAKCQNVIFGPILYPLGLAADYAYVGPYRDLLTTHLISRIIYTGCGTIKAAEFMLSEKPLIITHIVRRFFILDIRPVFETHNFFKSYFRMLTLFSKGSYTETFNQVQRLQINMSDSNMADVSEYLKIGSTYLLLLMAKAGYQWQPPQLLNPLHALSQINADPSLSIAVDTNQGKLSALALQKHYLVAAKDFFSQQTVVKPEYLDILQLWEKTLNALENDPGKLLGQVDWVTKYFLLAKSNHALGSDEAKKLDLKYHELSSGYFELLNKRALTQELVSNEEIHKALTEPPDTRAALRSRLIKELLNKPGQINVGWNRITYKEKKMSRKKVIQLDKYR